jgi:hypothetical protein
MHKVPHTLAHYMNGSLSCQLRGLPGPVAKEEAIKITYKGPSACISLFLTPHHRLVIINLDDIFALL